MEPVAGNTVAEKTAQKPKFESLKPDTTDNIDRT